MNLSIRLIHGNRLRIHKGLFLHYLLSLKEQAVRNVRKNIVKRFQGLGSYLFFTQIFSPPKSDPEADYPVPAFPGKRSSILTPAFIMVHRPPFLNICLEHALCFSAEG